MRHPLRSIALFCVLALCLPAGWVGTVGAADRKSVV